MHIIEIKREPRALPRGSSTQTSPASPKRRPEAAMHRHQRRRQHGPRAQRPAWQRERGDAGGELEACDDDGERPAERVEDLRERACMGASMLLPACGRCHAIAAALARLLHRCNAAAMLLIRRCHVTDTNVLSSALTPHFDCGSNARLPCHASTAAPYAARAVGIGRGTTASFAASPFSLLAHADWHHMSWPPLL